MQKLCAAFRVFSLSSKQAVWTGVVIAWSAFCCVGLVRADVKTWDGSYNGYWSAPLNWTGGVAPVNGDDLVFPAGAANLTNTNNAVTQVNSIVFTGDGYTLRGYALAISNGITSVAWGGNTVNLDVSLGASQYFDCLYAGASLTVDGAVDLGTDTLTVSGSGDTALDGAISGAGGVTKIGTGTLTFAGLLVNSYSGVTTVNSGLVELDKFLLLTKATAIPGDLVIGDGTNSATVRNEANSQIADSANLTINSGGTWDLNDHDETIGTGLVFNGGLILSGLGTASLSPNATITTSSTSSLCWIVGNLNVGSGTLTLQGDGQLDLFASVSGSANIVENGSMSMVLLNSNSFTGTLTANDSGLVTLDNPFALGATSGGTTLNDEAWIVFGKNVNITNEALTINSTYSGGALSSSANSSNSWLGNITLGSDCTLNARTNSVLELDGPIMGSGGFTKIGPGTLTLSGATDNTYTGPTAVDEGELQLNKSAGHSIGSSSSLTVGDGIGGRMEDVVRYVNPHGNQIFVNIPIYINTSGLLDLNDHTDDVGPVSLDGGTILTGTGALELKPGLLTTLSSTNGTSYFYGNLALLSSSTLTVSNALYMPAKVSGSSIYSFSKTGPGQLYLTASNSYAGLTVVEEGSLWVEDPSALGATDSGTVVSNGASLVMWGSDLGITNESLTLNGPGKPGYGALSSEMPISTNLWVGSVTLNADSSIAPDGEETTLRIIGPIDGPGGLTEIARSGTNGVLSLEGGAANTYAGITTVSNGVLVLDKPFTIDAVPGDLVIDGSSSVVRLGYYEQIADTADVQINSGGLLDFGDFSESFNTLHGNGSINYGASGYLNIGVGNGTSTFDGVMSGAGLPGRYAVGKHGTGTFTMNGDNTYQNGSEVFGGKLVINGYQPQSPVLSVAPDATLAGSGTVGAITAQGIVAPGDGPGILVCSNLTFAASGDFQVELTGPIPGTGYDQLNVRGTNNLANATLTVSPDFTTPVGIGDQFTIIKNDGADPTLGTFNGLPEGSAFAVGGYTFQVSYAGRTGNDVVLTLSDVPGAETDSRVVSGNGDARIDSDECDTLYLTVTNNTSTPMTDAVATLISADANVIVTQPSAPYADVPPGGTSTNAVPFQISVLPSFVCGSRISLNLVLKTSSHGTFTVPVTLPSGESASVPVRVDNLTSVAIPDVGSVESTNTVSGFSGPVAKVVASLYITHTYDQDLTNISLISPDGTTVLLSSANGGSGLNYGSGTDDTNRATFDDEAAISIVSGTAPFVGTYRPQSPLSLFTGNPNVNGNWRLHIADGFGGSLGTLRAWSLYLYPAASKTGGGACALCPDGTLYSSTLDTTSAVMTNRLHSSGVVSTCGAVKPFPGAVSGTFYYHAYPFYNASSNACITVIFTGSSGSLMSSAYLGTFDPANLSSNYLGDFGNFTSSGAYSFNVPANSIFIVVVSGDAGSTYSLSVSGGECSPVLDIQPVDSSSVDVSWPTVAGGYKLEAVPSLSSTDWNDVTNEPIAVDSRFNVTNSTVAPTKRFYRLHKPR